MLATTAPAVQDLNLAALHTRKAQLEREWRNYNHCPASQIEIEQDMRTVERSIASLTKH